ncbi:MAG: nitroreductase family protein [Tenuifilaceae bacterium]|jgi:nitroreductase|uniref:nitroreductase family protein n=1 Tax=Perlabentimonas gracilis TaxID=2715279 RepID=UPI00140C0ED8|nr:nitroreductase family protein [Perlabentimonas gracilis]MDX9768863.1 nitroreductase family protein [Tenuifilaceae bacterium]NHB68189.1 nitroreductase [Perlabentimonas gracilis]
MKSFLDLAKSRYSCRSYSEQVVPKDTIMNVLEAARIAPSATNAQPWRFVILTQPEVRHEVASCYSGEWLKSAPVIIVACGNHSESWRRADGKDHCDIDLAIGIDHITLAAAEHGLGTCWICKFDAMRCAEMLKLPKGVAPIALIPLGVPAEKNNYSERHLVRKSMDEIVTWEGYNF